MAKVVPLASAQAFLDALEKSGLLAASDVAALRASQGDDTTPKLIARDLVRDNKLTRWQAGQLLHGFHQLVMGKYKLLDQLGTGEMGRVYLAEHAQLARKVSLKILARRYTANPEILKQVLEDGRKAAALDHRNLTHVFDVNSEDERYYLVTEYVEGKNLKQLVEASGATSPSQALDLVRQTAEGLHHAHAQGVIHGDLKPSNLIIDASGVVKILDLGLARLTQTTPAPVGEESTEVATLATLSFRAPEQASQSEVSPLVDIYSLGGILFYLLSGKPPLGNIKSSQDVSSACPSANDELTELCANMLAETPGARPQSAEAVIAGLDAAARAKPKPPQEAKKAEGDKQPAKQKKTLVAKLLETPFPEPTSAGDEIGQGIVSVEDSEQPTDLGHSPSPDAAAAGATSEDPFAGFSVQTKRKKPRPETASSSPAAASGPVATPVPSSEAALAPVRTAQKPSLAIVLVAGIGGGVLILGIGITVLIWVLSRGGDQAVDKNAIAKADPALVQAAAAKTASEANPEVNPEANPEANPAVPASPAVPKAAEKTPPAATPEAPKTTVPPMANPGLTDPVTTGAKPPLPMPEAKPVVPTPPVVPPPATTNPEPPKPEPAKPEPPKPMPEPAPPAGNPLETFAKVVTLPTLEEKGKPVADATQPFLLGSLKLPPKALCLINLKGGDNAISTIAKQKFVLEAGNNGTSERDWDIKLATEGSPATVTVARLELQDDQLRFNWTDDATKQVNSAPYLCNCVLMMQAGSGSHQLALRQPKTAEPMKVDLEKAMLAKFTIDYPPNPKQVVIELGPPEGKFPKFKFERPELTAKSDNTMFMTGPGEGVFLLHFKLNCAMTGRLLKIDAQPQFQIHPMTKPEKYVKARMAKLIEGTEAVAQRAIQQQNVVTANLNSIPVDRRAQAEAEVKKLVEDTATQKTQAVMLKDLVKDLQGDGKIHFRIFYEADSETRIELISTGGPPPLPPTPPAAP